MVSTKSDLRKRDNGRGGTLAGGTVRKYLNTLSGMYGLLLAEYRGVVTENPVELMPEKPTDRSAGTVAPLPPQEVAILLDTALRMRDDAAAPGATPFLPEIVHVAALTGARWSEIAELRVEDVDLERGGIRIEPNDWRGLKTKRAARTVPLWPQLGKVRRPHVERRRFEGGDVLFPSPSDGPETMLDNVRGSSRASESVQASRSGIRPTSHTFTSVGTGTGTRTRTSGSRRPSGASRSRRTRSHARSSTRRKT